MHIVCFAYEGSDGLLVQPIHRNLPTNPLENTHTDLTWSMQCPPISHNVGAKGGRQPCQAVLSKINPTTIWALAGRVSLWITGGRTIQKSHNEIYSPTRSRWTYDQSVWNIIPMTCLGRAVNPYHARVCSHTLHDNSLSWVSQKGPPTHRQDGRCWRGAIASPSRGQHGLGPWTAQPQPMGP